MSLIELKPTNSEEFQQAVEQMRLQVHQWRGPVSFCSSRAMDGTGGIVMAHHYVDGTASERVQSFVIRPTYLVTSDEIFVCRDLTEQFLDEGFAVSVQPGTIVSHIFHRGKHPNASLGVSYMSFAVRMSDDDALLMLLRDFTNMLLLRVNGPYSTELYNGPKMY